MNTKTIRTEFAPVLSDIAASAAKLAATGKLSYLTSTVLGHMPIDKETASNMLTDHSLTMVLVAAENADGDTRAVMSALKIMVKESPEKALALAQVAYADACAMLTDEKPASTGNIQGKATADGASPAARKIFQRMRARFVRGAGIDFSCEGGLLVAKVMPEKVKAEKPESEETDSKASERASLPAPTLADCALALVAAGPAGMVAALTEAGADWQAVLATLSALADSAVAKAA